ncbi:MAG TPA: ABC transporter ATP-binding protein [Abditibacteriaceae bacterium]|jgi:subfamily B ATP-binding cassette protein MsbA
MENLKRLSIYLRPHKPAVIIGAFCALTSGMIGVGLIYLIKQVLEPILSTNLPPEVRSYRLNLLVVTITTLALLRVFVDFGQVYIVQRTGQRIFTRLREDLFKHFQNLPVGFFEGHRTGEIISRLTNDLTSLTTLTNLGVTIAVGAPIELVGALGLMLYFNAKLSLFVLVIMPPMAILINRAGRRIRRAATDVQQQAANLTEYLQEKFAAMRLIQTFGTRDYEIQLFDKVNQNAYRATMKPIRIHATLAPLIDFIGMMGILLALWFGARAIQTPGDVAGLIAFLMALHRVATRSKSLASLSLILKQADAAAARIWEVLDTEPHIRNAPNAVALNGIRGHLKLEDVRFSYGEKTEIPSEEQREVLKGISLEVKPGQMVALAGESGSGKSTIAALVPRLYDPSSGRVTIDGHDLRDVTLESLRSNIGAVPQETTLFHGTIRDNIAYGKPEATFEEIVEAAKKANADEFIRAQPQGYDTPIGERGNKLSGGQRQRIAIARALLRNPKVLILDEATASLDSKTEAAVQEALNTLMAGRTTLVIAHRFSTIQNADLIYVLDKGRVIESGKHQELLDKGGVYFNLYQAQTFAREDES